jgi:pyruvate/2-oxoglutarate/acetoin dehydrogenase E1 component
MNYRDELTKAMSWLGGQKDTVFLGQGVRYPGHGMFSTLSGVSMDKRVEMPVCEDMQMGMSIGMTLTGCTVISIYPRFDFLLLATNQLVNHLDKLTEFTHDEYNAKVIIRVGIGSTTPLNPGVQHCGDYTRAFRLLTKHIPVITLDSPESVMRYYQTAYTGRGSIILVEEMAKYA